MKGTQKKRGNFVIIKSEYNITESGIHQSWKFSRYSFSDGENMGQNIKDEQKMKFVIIEND